MKPINRGGGGRRFILILVLCGFSQGLSLDQLSGQDPPVQIAEDVFLLTGLGCNVLAIASEDGVLLIDNGRGTGVERLQEQVAILDSGPIRIAINTHFHFDHVGASEALGEAGVTIIGHDNARIRMTQDWITPEAVGVRYPRIPPYPEIALPTLTFDQNLTTHFADLEIQAVHFPNAHSDADVAVFVHDRNLVHTGDLYLSNGFPIEDTFHGGTIDGLLSALDGLIALIDDQTIVVPGHGPLSNRAELRAYREMLTIGKDRIAALISEGLSLEEIVEADPTAGLYEGESWLNPKLFVWTVFVDLTGQGR